MKGVVIGLMVGFIALVAYSCKKDELDIRQAYDFTLTHWYLPKTVVRNQEVEIRFTLNRSGEYAGTVYKISWVQMDGAGQVYDTDKVYLEPQEPYDMRDLANYDGSDPSGLTFTLYFRNTGTKSPKLKFIAIDNFGQRFDVDIEFEYEG